jgi:hypothetical protein
MLGAAESKSRESNFIATVFLDISFGQNFLGRIEIGLFADTPLTSEHFRKLCSGEHENLYSKKNFSLKLTILRSHYQ